MIICYLLAHYLELQRLPEYSFDIYLQSETNSCKVYSNNTWDVVGREGNKIIITNGVINVEGYFYGYK